MSLYDISTFKQSIKKYVVTLTIGTGIGLGIAYYFHSQHPMPQELSQPYQSNKGLDGLRTSNPRQPSTQLLTKEQQRLQVFETYTKP